MATQPVAQVAMKSGMTAALGIAKCTEYGGKLMEGFNQADYRWITEATEEHPAGIDQTGACFTLCLLWAKREAQQGHLGSGITFLQRAKVRPKMRTHISNMQKILITTDFQQQHRDRMLREANLARTGPETRIAWFASYVFNSQYPTHEDKITAYRSAVADAICGDFNGYRQISMSFPQAPGHAVAARYFGKEFVFFDPNGGVAEFPDRGSFRDWFLKLYIPRTSYEEATIFRINNFVPSAS